MLARNIEDEPGNTTRFLVIGRQVVAPSGNDKTSRSLHAQRGGAACTACSRRSPSTA